MKKEQEIFRRKKENNLVSKDNSTVSLKDSASYTTVKVENIDRLKRGNSISTSEAESFAEEIVSGENGLKTHRHFVEEMLKTKSMKFICNPGVSCNLCGGMKTGQWRKGPNGPRTLCNGCGIAYSKKLKKGPVSLDFV
ncbi:blue light receptor [Clydaea vesicula]|uniref:Blue light receptor n=1 Tax=Clydaea vesicula TaxID=447962 RepID=A0AAD5U3A1_9FUNG|nr:blue light receptor [Clydaea vesicula]